MFSTSRLTKAAAALVVLSTTTVSAEDDKRSSKQVWITENHWICGFIMHYANLANRHFQYNIDCIHQNALQYTVYNPGDHYTWHVDDIATPRPSVRKLSFSFSRYLKISL